MVEVFPRPAHFGLWTAAGRGEHVDWDALFEGFGAAVDWPAAALWPELAAAYPKAIILHSERDAEAWWKSASATIFARREGPRPAPMVAMLDSIMSDGRFSRDTLNKDAMIAAYERHNARVRAEAPKDRLVMWRPGDGWAPICAALELPVPATPFPHVNTTDEFNARVGSVIPT
jgi:hypothetical protein